VVTRCRVASQPLPATRPDAIRIWLSLRQMYRHPVNQIETFAAFLHVLRGCERPVEILFDG
jgi:hypothetical protein